MARARENLKGVFAPVVTPFRGDRIDFDALRFNLRRLAQSGLAGYLALGSNGEFRSLLDSERREVLSVFAEEKAGKMLMAGTGADSTAVSIAWTREAAELGFEYASLITPSYFARLMDDEVLVRHYLAVADASPIPILIYNIPGSAGGVQISPEAVRQLAEHPNIAGMKDSSSGGPAPFLAALPEDAEFAVISGSINTFYPTLRLGAAGGIVSLANALPDPCCRLYELHVQGDAAGAEALHERLVKLNKAVSGSGGVAAVKAAMDLHGYRGGEPRLPLVTLSGAERERMRFTFAEQGFPASDDGR